MRTFLCLLLLITTSYGIGRLCFYRVRFVRPAEEFVFSSALGLAFLSYAMLLLGAVGWMSPVGVALVFAACCLVAVPFCVRFLARIRWRLPQLDAASAVCLAILAAAAFVNTIVATSPILDVDGYEYHIPVPKAWLLEGRIFAVPYCVQSNYHLLGEMINVVALSLSPNDVVLCKLIQCYAGVLLAVATWCFGRSFFSARAAWLAATVLYLVKEIAGIATNGYIDLTVGLYIWLGIFAMVRAAHLRGWSWHATAGLFFGLGFAAKQTGAIFALISYVAYGVILLLDRHYRRRLLLFPARAALAGLVTALVASPWMIKNYIITGDPFFPFLTHRFNVPAEFAEAAADFTGYYGGLWRYIAWDSETWPQLLRAFYNFRTNVIYSGGNMLVVWMLISGLVLILGRCRAKLALQLLIAIGILVAPWFAWTWGRFLFGFYPAYTLILAQTLRLATGRRRTLFTVLAVVLLLFYARTFVRFHFQGGHVAALSVTGKPTFSSPAREQWLIRNNYEYPMIKEVNRLLGPRDRLLASGGSRATPWLEVRFMPNPDADLLNMLWKRWADPHAMDRWLDRYKITAILISDSQAEDLDRESRFVQLDLEKLHSESGLSLYRRRNQ